MNILLGVTGSISAYKSLDIISGLIATGHDVKVVQTEASEMFVTEMSLATMSKNPVIKSFDSELCGTVHHIELTDWANVLLIAPATANTIAKIANGIADNFLTSLVVAFRGTKIIAPAMNGKMFSNAIMCNNLHTIKSIGGWNIIDPINGIMACGDVGLGKLEKPRKIVEYVNKVISDEISN